MLPVVLSSDLDVSELPDLWKTRIDRPAIFIEPARFQSRLDVGRPLTGLNLNEDRCFSPAASGELGR